MSARLQLLALRLMLGSTGCAGLRLRMHEEQEGQGHGWLAHLTSLLASIATV